MNLHIIIPTRGDCDLSPIIKSFRGCSTPPEPQGYGAPIHIWDNSKLFDFQVFSRYLACASIPPDSLIYTQDDDCVLSDPLSFINSILDDLSDDDIAVNMPPDYLSNYSHTPEKLVGFGALFYASTVFSTFRRYLKYYSDIIDIIDIAGCDHVLFREADRIFTGLNHSRIHILNHPFTHLPHASSPSRLYTQLDHNFYRSLARERVLEILSHEGHPFTP